MIYMILYFPEDWGPKMPLVYEDYSCQVSAAKLEQEVDAMNGGAEKHLVAIAKELMDWEQVAPELYVLPKDVRDIKEMNASPVNKRYVQCFQELNWNLTTPALAVLASFLELS